MTRLINVSIRNSFAVDNIVEELRKRRKNVIYKQAYHTFNLIRLYGHVEMELSVWENAVRMAAQLIPLEKITKCVYTQQGGYSNE